MSVDSPIASVMQYWLEEDGEEWAAVNQYLPAGCLMKHWKAVYQTLKTGSQ